MTNNEPKLRELLLRGPYIILDTDPKEAHEEHTSSSDRPALKLFAAGAIWQGQI
jgi:hypothetical protein